MYVPIHCLFAAWALSYTFLPSSVATALWLVALLPYYLTTQGANHSGHRKW